MLDDYYDYSSRVSTADSDDGEDELPADSVAAKTEDVVVAADSVAARTEDVVVAADSVASSSIVEE